MPSLLDAFLKNQQIQGGLLGTGGSTLAARAQQAGMTDQGPQNLGGVLGSIFGGQASPLLSQQANTQSQRDALINAGLATLASDQRGLPALAEGVLVGRQTGQQSRTQALQQQIAAIKQIRENRKRQRREELLSGADLSNPQVREKITAELMAGGDFDAVDRMAKLEDKFSRDPVEIEGEGQVELIDPRTMETRRKVKVPEKPAGWKSVDTGGVVQLRDADTGQVIAEVSKTMAPGAFQERTQEIFDRTNALADDFRTETSGLQDALRMGESATDAPPTAAGDQTLVIALNKLLDPNSVVRQSEFTRTAEVGGFQAQAQQFANRLVSQGEFSPQTREILRDEIERLQQTNKQQLSEVADQFRQRATTFGVNPDYVVREGLQDTLLEREEEDEEEEQAGVSDPLNVLEQFNPGGGG